MGSFCICVKLEVTVAVVFLSVIATLSVVHVPVPCCGIHTRALGQRYQGSVFRNKCFTCWNPWIFHRHFSSEECFP